MNVSKLSVFDNLGLDNEEFCLHQTGVLERLLYRSKATHRLGSLHLFNLLALARERNLRLGITGHLLYSEEVFVQCIEGSPQSVEDLWQSIQRDDRHYDIELLKREPIQERRFNEWAMAFSTYASFNKYNIAGFFPIDKNGMKAAVQRCSAD